MAQDHLIRMNPLETLQETSAIQQTQETIKQKYAFIQAIEEAMPYGVAVIDSQGVQTYVNRAFCRLVGWSREELLGASAPFCYWSAGDLENIQEAFRSTLAGHIPPDGFEMKLQRKDGSDFDTQVIPCAMRDENGEITGWLASIVDISRRKKAERALRESEITFRALFENSRDAIGVASQGRILYVNRAYVTLLGYEREADLAGLSVLDVVAPEDREKLTTRRQQRAQGEAVPDIYEYKAIRADGTTIDIENHVSTYILDGELYTLVIARDVTDRRRAEEALRASERQLRLIINSAPILVAYIDLEERYRFHNKTYADWFGAEFADITGMKIEQVLGFEASEQLRPYRQAGLAGQDVRFERVVNFQRGGPRYLQGNYIPDRDAQDRINGCIFVATDITAAKRQEEAQRFLAQASEVLASSLDYETTLTSVSNLAVPRFADWCAVDILDEEGILQRVVTSHADPAKLELGLTYHRKYPPRKEANTGTYQVIRTGKTEWMSYIPEELIRTAVLDEEHYRIITELGLRSYICAPLISREKPIGAISFVNAESGREYQEEDVLFAENLAHRAALAVDNARLYRAAEEEIHDRKQAEAEIQALNTRLRRAMTETHHRVKNNLQVIAAMIDLQTIEQTETLPASEFARLSQHVRTLAAVHDLLTDRAKTDGEAHFISAKEVLERLLPMLQQMAEGRDIRFKLDDILLTSSQATSLALITNEICSNAIKHGGTEVEVNFSIIGGDAILQVCDNGPGFPLNFDSYRAAHTGLDLIHNLTSWDLRGEVVFENQTQGGGQVSIKFRLPVSTLSGREASQLFTLPFSNLPEVPE